MISQKLWKKRDATIHIRRNMMAYKKEVYIRENVHPAKTFLTPWFQIPMWVCLSIAYREMSGFWIEHDSAEFLRSDMGVEGILWFNNLLIPDSTHILPFLMSASMFIINEAHALQSLNPHWAMKCITWGLRIWCIVMLPLLAKLPAAMCLYWTTSSLIGLVHNLSMLSPRVRRYFGIGILPGESSTPYRDILENGKLRNERIIKAIRSKIG